MPLSAWIDVAVDGNFQALCISGEAPQDVLLMKWMELMEQYEALIGQELNGGMQNSLQKEAIRLEVKMINSRRMIEVLNDYYIPEFATAVNSMLNTNYAFDLHNPLQYEMDLREAYTSSKELEMKLGIKKAALDELLKKDTSEGGKVDRTYFDAILNNLSDWKTRNIDDSITVSRFCLLISQYNNYIAKQKSK